MNNIFTTENTIFIIFILLVLIQIYINYFFKENTNIIIKEEKISNISVPLYKELGIPSNIINGKKGRIYTWEIEKPQPWNVIVYIENDKYPYKFSFKYNLNNYKVKINKWHEIIPNLSYSNNLLIIPAKDENGALVILNLLLKNITNELDFNDIIENNLITKSLAKINNFKIIRTKIIEQINELSNDNNNNNNIDNGDDLAEENNIMGLNNNTGIINSKINNIVNNNFGAYGGDEFSFL